VSDGFAKSLLRQPHRCCGGFEPDGRRQANGVTERLKFTTRSGLHARRRSACYGAIDNSENLRVLVEKLRDQGLVNKAS
jgi:hypothetical protein